MVRLILFLFLVVSVHAANVFIFNPASSPVARRGIAYYTSVNTTEYFPSNSVINPTIPNGIQIQWLKESNGFVMPMTAAESNSILSADTAMFAAQEALIQGLSKTNAINTLALNTLEARLIRAVAEVTLDEINILRASPTNVFAARTLQQMTNAIRNKLEAQSASNP